jgi:hypothetical protein
MGKRSKTLTNGTFQGDKPYTHTIVWQKTYQTLRETLFCFDIDHK